MIKESASRKQQKGSHHKPDSTEGAPSGSPGRAAAAMKSPGCHRQARILPVWTVAMPGLAYPSHALPVHPCSRSTPGPLEYMDFSDHITVSRNLTKHIKK